MFVGNRALGVSALVILSFLGSIDASAQFLPTGFADEVLLDVGLDKPVDLAFLPDGRVLIIEHNTGSVKVFARGQLGEVGVVSGMVPLSLEDGLNAVAVDPGWPAKPYLWVYYTHEDSAGQRTNRLARLRCEGELNRPDNVDIRSVAQLDVIDDIPSVNDTHNGGVLRFDNDGALLLSLGDGGFPCEAQNIDSMLGKVIRLDVSGIPPMATTTPAKSTLVPPGNPFTVGTDIARLVFCMGLRNPWRGHYDPVMDCMCIGDVGDSGWEEINIATGGENFGWPWFEGNSVLMGCTGGMPPNVFPPVISQSHGNPGFSAIIPFGGIYRNEPAGILNFGSAYEGQLFYADIGAFGPILRAHFDGASWIPAPDVPGQVAPGLWGMARFPVGVRRGPDGALYYVNYTFKELRRIKSLTNATQLSIEVGGDQLGNAGWPSLVPLVVRLTDLAGSPLAGRNVWFGITQGGGMLGSPAVTDSNGRVSCSYSLPEDFEGTHPIVTAMHEASNAVQFNIRWRGLSVSHDVSTASLSMLVRHSEAFSPITLSGQFPVTSPFASIPQGEIWTSVLSPDPGFLPFGDGLGLTGFPNPAMQTDAGGIYSHTVSGIPILGDLEFHLQALALDLTASTTGEMVMISNRVDVILP